MEKAPMVEKTLAVLVSFLLYTKPAAFPATSFVSSRLVFGAPLSSIGYSAAFAPRVEVYTQLACRVHKPEYFPGSPSSVFSQPLISHVARVSITSPTKTGAVGDPSYLFIPNATYEDPETRKKCATDPDVQAKVARLSASMSHAIYCLSACSHLMIALSTTMGILSCLVTGWWGSVGLCRD